MGRGRQCTLELTKPNQLHQGHGCECDMHSCWPVLLRGGHAGPFRNTTQPWLSSCGLSPAMEYLHQLQHSPSSRHLIVSSFAGGNSFCMQFLITRSYSTILENEEEENSARRGIAGVPPALSLTPTHQPCGWTSTLPGPFCSSGQNLLCVCVLFFINMLSCLFRGLLQ